MAFSRRRIPYSVGGEQLDRARTVPKKFLSAVEQERLNADMLQLYHQILPSADSNDRRAKFVARLHHNLNKRWPDSNIEVHVFGSSGNLLCTSDSDVDICITTRMKTLERTCLLAAALAEDGMERVVCVPHAKVPIVKFWDPKYQVACDMNVNNTLALQNTRMIKTFVEIDDRVRPLAMIIKHWTKKRVLNDAALGGTLSSYTWICMILNFLQTRNPPILPSLHSSDATAFDDDPTHWRDFGQPNKENLAELLFHFFRRYAHDIDYERSVISVRQGQLISKEAKRWHLMQNNRLCVEEPFNVERNLGNTADDISFRGLHLELRRAFDLTSCAELDKCLEQYEDEGHQALTRTRSQSTRGATRPVISARPVRINGETRSRRASSAAAAQNAPPFPPRHAPMSQTSILKAQYEQLRLHRRLFDEMQTLQRQEYDLRLKQAQNLLQAEMDLQPNDHSPAKYPYYGGYSNPHTQPSSPLLQPVQPDLRREAYRPPRVNDSSTRSHSQPARSLPPSVPPLILNHQQILNLQNLRQYHQLQQERYLSSARYLPFPENLKEYAGYWVHEDPENVQPDASSIARDRSSSLRTAAHDAQWHLENVYAMPPWSYPPGEHEVSPLDLSQMELWQDYTAPALPPNGTPHHLGDLGLNGVDADPPTIRLGAESIRGPREDHRVGVDIRPRESSVLKGQPADWSKLVVPEGPPPRQLSPKGSIPLLSPVREVRTPSPAGRTLSPIRPHVIEKSIIGKMDLRIPTFRELKQNKQSTSSRSDAPLNTPKNTVSRSEASAPTLQTTPLSAITTPLKAPQNTPTSVASPAPGDGWQQALGRKGRREVSGRSVPEAAKRKGG